MDQKSSVRQPAGPAPAKKINGEKLIAQLEELLDQYENLDRRTLNALEQAFNNYKTLRPGLLKDLLNKGKTPEAQKQTGAARNPAVKPEVPPATASDDVAKMLEDHASTRRRECLEAEKALAEARAQYEYQKTVLSVYEETVLPFIEPFKKVMANLVYFAACADEAVYEAGKTPLRNKSRALRNAVQPGMWGEHLDAAHLDRIGEMFAVEKAAAPFRFREETGDAMKRVTAYQNRIAAANEQRKPYDTENAKLTNRIKQAQMLWEYVDLLRCFLPQLEKITATPEEEESAQWATQIGAALLAGVKNHHCRNTKMKFLWVYPHGEIAARSERIRVQFIAAELDCPGLYYRFTEDHDGMKRLGCVIPGYSKE